MDSVQLYNQCKSDEPQAQAQAYNELFAYLYRVSFGIVYRQPDGDALAQDCAQDALVKIYQELYGLLEPKAFLSWSRRIVHNRTIDELRKRKRLRPLITDADQPDNPNLPPAFLQEMAKSDALEQMTTDALRILLDAAPISDRSRRVVNGRYLDNHDDDYLAQQESELSGKPVHASHIQVTRSKNISKLKNWPQLTAFLQNGIE